MKFTLSWLKDQLRTESPLADIVEALTTTGLEVEGLEDPSILLEPFRVARVVSSEPHPNAKKLSVCQVDTGAATVQVVCGAPNARAGLLGVFAPAGTTVPGTGLKLEAAVIRGVESNGMLCSELEMGISEEHRGIIELPAEASVGGPFAEVLGLDDPVIEISVTANRPDWLGVSGVARDLAAAGVGEPRDVRVEAVPGTFPSPIAVGVRFSAEHADACPLFAGRTIRGVENGASPAWLQRRLRAIGLRPISALVDITNYVTYDRGRPLHVYDADRLEGEIHARLANRGESFDALDDHRYELDETMCVIADDSGVLGLGGVIGGVKTGCTAETHNVFIESALFDPIRTATTGRKLGIESDARYRFERGVDPEFVIPGLELATHLVLEFCQGDPSAVVVAGRVPEWRRQIDFRIDQVARLTGMKLPKAEIVRPLQALGFGVAEDGATLRVDVPSWRPDVHREADLVEEVVRIKGLDNLPAIPMAKPVGVTPCILTPSQQCERRTKRALADRGLVEAVTWSFVSWGHAQHFGGGQQELRIENPISSELDTMRPSLLPGLVLAVGRNLNRGFHDVALFEVGPQYAGARPADQRTVASGVRRGTTGHRDWLHSTRPIDVFDVKADVLAVLRACGIRDGEVEVTTGAPPWYHPGRSGVLRLGKGREVANFGEIHPRILGAMGVKGPIGAFEVLLSALPAPAPRASSKPPLDASDLQTVERDFAFLVDRDVPAETLIAAARSADPSLIEAVQVFDVFEGEGVEAGKKSLAITARLQPRQKTLTDPEIERISERIIERVQKATRGTLRS